MSQLQLTASTWQEISAERFQTLWQAEVSQAPTHTTKTFYLITGLLLPIWDRLDSENLRVWSLTADNGERLRLLLLTDFQSSWFFPIACENYPPIVGG